MSEHARDSDIKLLFAVHIRCVLHAKLQVWVFLFGHFDHFRGRVDANDAHAGIVNLARQRPDAATDVQHEPIGATFRDMLRQKRAQRLLVSGAVDEVSGELGNVRVNAATEPDVAEVVHLRMKRSASQIVEVF